jgi:hypothetical protein
MALKINKTYNKLTTVKINNVVVSNSPETVSTTTYARVETVSGDKKFQRADVLFYDYETRSILLERCTYHNLSVDINSNLNFITQVYNTIKTYPEFEGSEDV